MNYTLNIIKKYLKRPKLFYIKEKNYHLYIFLFCVFSMSEIYISKNFPFISFFLFILLPHFLYVIFFEKNEKYYIADKNINTIVVKDKFQNIIMLIPIDTDYIGKIPYKYFSRFNFYSQNNKMFLEDKIIKYIDVYGLYTIETKYIDNPVFYINQNADILEENETIYKFSYNGNIIEIYNTN